MSRSTGSDDTQQLTPYETGARLEPHPWVRGTAAPLMPPDLGSDLVSVDDFGRVDFDDESGRTVVTICVERGAAGYVVHLSDLVDDSLAITGDGEAVVLGIEHRTGIEELIELAQRGRQAYLQEAERGAHSQDDQDAAALRWVTAHHAAVAIHRQLAH